MPTRTKHPSGRRSKTTFDFLSEAGRSSLMGRIRSKDTKPELTLRKSLFRDGLRYRKHKKDLPGKPDVVVIKYRLIVDVRGCFWHGHENCPDGHTPRKNSDFWIAKLKKNKERDKKNLEKYENLGYKVFVLWGCEIMRKKQLESKLSKIYNYLNSTYGLGITSKSNNLKRGKTN